jgi:hypothetical protein
MGARIVAAGVDPGAAAAVHSGIEAKIPERRRWWRCGL